MAILNKLVRQPLAKGGLSVYDTQRALLVIRGAPSLAVEDLGNQTLARIMRTRLLTVMGDLATGLKNGSLLVEQATHLVTSVEIMANASVLDAKQQAAGLQVLRRTLQAADGTSPALHEHTVGALASLVEAGLLRGDDCLSARQDVMATQVLDELGELAVRSLTPASSGYSANEPELGRAGVTLRHPDNSQASF